VRPRDEPSDAAELEEDLTCGTIVHDDKTSAEHFTPFIVGEDLIFQSLFKASASSATSMGTRSLTARSTSVRPYSGLHSAYREASRDCHTVGNLDSTY
jgi:hypothetical protein